MSGPGGPIVTWFGDIRPADSGFRAEDGPNWATRPPSSRGEVLDSGRQPTRAWTASGFLKLGSNGTLGWPFVSGPADPKAVFNPTHALWVSLAGNAGAMTLVNTLVVAGDLGIGIALVLGLATQFASAMAALMMLFFFIAAWSFSTGIVIQHLTYAVVALGLIGAGNYYGFDATVGPRVSKGLRRWLLSADANDGWRAATARAS